MQIVPIQPQKIDGYCARISASLGERNNALVMETDSAVEVARKRTRDFTMQFMRRVVRVVADGEGVSVTDILSERRTIQVAYPRHICIYLCVKMTGFSLPRIGKFFGNRDHTTIINSRNRVPILAAGDATFAAKVEHYRAVVAPFAPKLSVQEGPQPKITISATGASPVWRIDMSPAV